MMNKPAAIALSLLFSAQVLLCAERPTAAIGQAVTQGASVDGTRVLSGTTVLDGSFVSSGTRLVFIQLITGQMLELSKNSGATFQAKEGGVQVLVKSGTISFLGSEGQAVTVPSGAVLLFPDKQPGRPAMPVEPGVVAVLSRNAGKGDQELRVNDTTRVHSRGEIVIRSRDGRVEEVHKISSTTENTIKIRTALHNGYPNQSPLIQIVDGKAMSGAGRQGTLVGSGRLLGIGVGGGLVSGVAVGSGNEDEGAKELSPVQPN
jgi:hypothetical protein